MKQYIFLGCLLMTFFSFNSLVYAEQAYYFEMVANPSDGWCNTIQKNYTVNLCNGGVSHSYTPHPTIVATMISSSECRYWYLKKFTFAGQLLTQENFESIQKSTIEYVDPTCFECVEPETWNESTGACEPPPPPPCDQPGEFTEQQCFEAYPGATYNPETCDCTAPDCNDEYAIKLEECGDFGVLFWSNYDCTGHCDAPDKCGEAIIECDEFCGELGTKTNECVQQGDDFESDCVCNTPDDLFNPIPSLPGPDDPTTEPGLEPDPDSDPLPSDNPPSWDGPDLPDIPDALTPPPNDSPTTPPVGEESKWLKPIKENTDDLKDQVRDVGGDLKKVVTNQGKDSDIQKNIAGNIAKVVDNQGVLSEDLKVIGKNTGAIADNQAVTGGKLDGIMKNTGDTVEGLKDINEKLGGFKKGEITGTADLPTSREYDPLVDEVAESVEGGVFAVVADFITSGLPLVGYIQGTSLNVTGSDPSLSASLWGTNVEFRIDQYQDILNKMGLVLVFCTTVAAFNIIIGRW